MRHDILGRKGKLDRMTKAMRQLIIQPRRQHSRKPDEFYDRVLQYVGDRKLILDMFTRERRDGFTPFGDEIDRFASLQSTECCRLRG